MAGVLDTFSAYEQVVPRLLLTVGSDTAVPLLPYRLILQCFPELLPAPGQLPEIYLLPEPVAGMCHHIAKAESGSDVDSDDEQEAAAAAAQPANRAYLGIDVGGWGLPGMEVRLATAEPCNHTPVRLGHALNWKCHVTRTTYSSPQALMGDVSRKRKCGRCQL